MTDLTNLSAEQVAAKFVGVRFLGYDKKNRERFECSKQKNGQRPTRVVTDRNDIAKMLIQLEAIADMKNKQQHADVEQTNVKRTRNNVRLTTKKGKLIWTLEEGCKALEKFYKDEAVSSKEVSEAGLKTKENNIKLVRKELKQLDCVTLGNDTPLSEIADDDVIEDYKDYLREEACVADITADKRLSVLNKMFWLAKKKKHLDITYKCERYNVQGGNIHFLKDDELDSIESTFNKMGKLDHEEVTICLTDLGCRQDDLWRLTERDVDWSKEQPTVYIKASKNGLDREIKISERCLPIFKRRATGKQNLRIFPYNNDWFANGWKPMRNILGRDEKWFTPHVLRHTCASRLAQDNMSPAFIKDYLGHKSIQATYKYMHLAPKNLNECVDVINKRNGSVTVRNTDNQLQNLQLNEQQLRQVAELLNSFSANQSTDTKDIASPMENGKS